MSMGLGQRQLASIPWSTLKSGVEVRELLRVMLFSADAPAAAAAYREVQNSLVGQGALFPCAPAVVSVIMAGITDGSIAPSNVGPALDLLGLILLGRPDEAADDGGTDLRVLCRAEALRGHWALWRLALAPEDPLSNAGLAREIIALIDDGIAEWELPMAGSVRAGGSSADQDGRGRVTVTGSSDAGQAKEYIGYVWVGDEPAVRVRVMAAGPTEAQAFVIDHFGTGHVMSIWNEEDAQRLR